MSPEEQLDKFLRSVAAAAAAGSNLDEVVVEDDYAVVQKPASKVKAGPGSSGWRSMDSLGRYSMPRRKVMNHFKALSKSYESKFVKRWGPNDSFQQVSSHFPKELKVNASTRTILVTICSEGYFEVHFSV